LGRIKKGTGKALAGKLNAVIFLRHGRKISVQNITRKETLKALLRTALFFSRDNINLNKLLSFANDLSLKVPARILSFRKDSRKTDILKSITESLKMRTE